MTVRWRTKDLTALHNKDYIGGEGTLTFEHGETSKTINLKILETNVRHPYLYSDIYHRDYIMCKQKATVRVPQRILKFLTHFPVLLRLLFRSVTNQFSFTYSVENGLHIRRIDLQN